MKKSISFVLACMLLTVAVLFCGCSKTPDVSSDTPTVNSDILVEYECEHLRLPEPIAKYDSLIKKYTELLNAKKSGEELGELSDDVDEVNEAVWYAVNKAVAVDKMGYALKDLDGNGVDELLLMSRDCKLYAIFTLSGEKVVLLTKLNPSNAFMHSDGSIYSTRSDSESGEHVAFLQSVDGASLKGFELIDCSEDSFYIANNGEREEISSEDFIKIRDMMVLYADSSRPYTTKAFGLRFISAFEDSKADPDAPTADFSSYNAVLETYEHIVKSLDGYDRDKWIAGDYDTIFNFESDVDYYVFNKLLMAVANARPRHYEDGGRSAYGCAVKDIDGDGNEELVLMSDSYGILALFTEKNGKAVFLDAFYSDPVAWMDENGIVRAQYRPSGISKEDREFATYELRNGTFEATLVFGYAYDPEKGENAFYKLDGSEKVEISAEELVGLQMEYNAFNTDQKTEREYSKQVSGLEFVSLFEKGKPFKGEALHTVLDLSFDVVNTELTVREVGSDYVICEIKKSAQSPFYMGDEPPEVKELLNGEAKCFLGDHGTYRFSIGVAQGYLDFMVDGVWLVVEQSEIEELACGVYMLERPYVYE